MQKSMLKTLTMILMTVMIAATVIGFVTAADPACDESNKCKCHILDNKCTCNDLSCNECNCQCETCDDCIDPKDPPATDPPESGVKDPAAAGGDPNETQVAAAGDNTVAMQKTGVPVAMLVIGVLITFAGFAMPKRK